MGSLHRKRLTEEKIRTGLNKLGKLPEGEQTLTRLASLLNVPYGDLRFRMQELEISPLRLPAERITKSQIEEAIKELGGATTITAVAVHLSVSPARLKRAWDIFGFPEPNRGRPKLDREADEIDTQIVDWKGTDTELATTLGLSKEAIRQRRTKLGVLTYEQRRKRQAQRDLLKQDRPALIAVRYGFTQATVKKWLSTMVDDPICLARYGCDRKATIKAKPTDVAPAICKGCHKLGYFDVNA